MKKNISVEASGLPFEQASNGNLPGWPVPHRKRITKSIANKAIPHDCVAA